MWRAKRGRAATIRGSLKFRGAITRLQGLQRRARTASAPNSRSGRLRFLLDTTPCLALHIARLATHGGAPRAPLMEELRA